MPREEGRHKHTKPRDTAEPKPRRKKKTQLFDIRPPRKVPNEPKPQILENESEDRTRKRTEEHTSETDPSQAKPRISTSSQTQPIHHKKQEINTHADQINLTKQDLRILSLNQEIKDS
ncbi:hypothetical protein F2Q69_00019527 [Brassica cretica]|uniref:Uncharacterized protein n=1 Tax=Brassica cretica TaxID=69181 RepID=A0A8S9QH77_BRACR|nr:hypothetical protein F2Q69_00019527 [Brassica cretica]